jgi:hypothetical protein
MVPSPPENGLALLHIASLFWKKNNAVDGYRFRSVKTIIAFDYYCFRHMGGCYYCYIVALGTWEP